MRLSEIRLLSLHLPFCREVSHNLFARRQTEAVIAVVSDESGCCGLGEGTPREFVTGERMDDCLSAAANLAKILLAQRIESPDDLLVLLENTGDKDMAQRHPAAWCALETACLDLYAKTQSLPLWRLFTGQSSAKAFNYSAVLPLISDDRSLGEILDLVKSMQLPSVKIKVADVQDGIDCFRRVRRELGGHISLRVDANGAFSADQALRFLEGTLPHGILALEQPVARADFDGLARVARFSPVPIIADESLYAQGSPEHFIDRRLCQGINLRLSSCGGILRSLKLVRRVHQNGLQWQLGAHVGETAVLSLAARQFAAASSGYMSMEGSFSKLVLKEDLCEKDIGFGFAGRAALPDGSGLGVAIDMDRLDRWAERVAVIQ
jgi:muconate cycloisomerase